MRTQLAGEQRAATPGLLTSLVMAAVLASSVRADMYHADPSPGGIDPRPLITGLTSTSSNATLSWYGPTGPYQVQLTPTLNPVVWSSVANFTASTYGNQLTLGNLPGDQAYFRLNAPPNGYVGTGGCAGCHGDKYMEWYCSAHASAYDSIANVSPTDRQSCLPCHTVGNGQTGGFVDPATTPHLADVGCESCHGPGGAHKYGDHYTVHPIVTVAGEVCGGCHTGPQSPTYEEWKESGHGNNEVLAEISGALAEESTRMRCGPCHSGAVRSAMLANYEAAAAGRPEPLTLPGLADATNFGPTCVTCHDPHLNERPRQLRLPLFSTNFFTFYTGAPTTNIYRTNWAGMITTNTYWANSIFASQYQTNMQLCAQCHNDRGANWQSSSRPPHRSPQYNLMIGAVQTNYLNGTNITMIRSHGRNSNGCVQCHMNLVTVADPSPANPNNTGHRFEIGYEGCANTGCHSSPTQAEIAIIGTQFDATNRIRTVVGLLNQWAVNNSPPILRTNHGALAWEYTSPGALSNPGTNSGPSSARQAFVPDTIKQARFNLYLVFQDASLGVHNGDYSRLLLDLAKSNVNYAITH